MKATQLGIAVGGERRLRKAVEAQVRQRHQEELAAATDHWKKAAIEEQIEREFEEQMQRVASPQSLWGTPS